MSEERELSDAEKLEIVGVIADLLGFQLAFADDQTIEDPAGSPQAQSTRLCIRIDRRSPSCEGAGRMADISIGVPITFQVIRRLWPAHVNKIMDYLVNNIGTDPLMMTGVMLGGQQYLDFVKHGSDSTPLGARALYD